MLEYAPNKRKPYRANQRPSVGCACFERLEGGGWSAGRAQRDNPICLKTKVNRACSASRSCAPWSWLRRSSTGCWL